MDGNGAEYNMQRALTVVGREDDVSSSKYDRSGGKGGRVKGTEADTPHKV